MGLGAADGEQAIAVTRDLAPDVVLMDLAMPAVNGIDATRAILQTHPATAVLVLTMAETDDPLTAWRAGARGYLVKGADRQEITNALPSVAVGQAVFGTGIADRILGRLTSPPPRANAAISDAFPQLTEREAEILCLLARGLSNRAIATKLFLSDKTVRNHVSNVLAKTGAPDRQTAACLARRAGPGTHPTVDPQTP